LDGADFHTARNHQRREITESAKSQTTPGAKSQRA
jgi:hypothetical protein